jgi:hypothetical protein
LDVDFSQVVVSLVKTDRVQTDRQKERNQARKKEFAMGSFKRTHTAGVQHKLLFLSALFFLPFCFLFSGGGLCFLGFLFLLVSSLFHASRKKKNWHEMYVEEEGEIIIVFKKGGSSRKIVEILWS